MGRYSKIYHDEYIDNPSVRDAFRAIDSVQVVGAVVYICEPKLSHVDLTIAQRVIEEGRALMLSAKKYQPRRCSARDATSPGRVAEMACMRARYFCGTHLRASRQ